MLKVITPAVQSNLTELSAVKRDLGIADTDASQDARLTDIIATASDLVTQYLNRDTLGQEILEQTEHCVRGAGPIILARDINVVIESVTVNGVVLAPETYHLDGSLLQPMYAGYGYGYGGVWASNGFAVVTPFAGGWLGRHVVIRYTAGFNLPAGLPRSIEAACKDVIFSLYASGTRDRGIRSETVEGVGSTTYVASGSDGALPIAPDRLMALERWRYRAGL